MGAGCPGREDSAKWKAVAPGELWEPQARGLAQGPDLPGCRGERARPRAQGSPGENTSVLGPWTLVRHSLGNRAAGPHVSGAGGQEPAAGGGALRSAGPPQGGRTSGCHVRRSGSVPTTHQGSPPTPRCGVQCVRRGRPPAPPRSRPPGADPAAPDTPGRGRGRGRAGAASPVHLPTT